MQPERIISIEIIDSKVNTVPVMNLCFEGDIFPVHSRYDPIAEAKKIAINSTDAEMYIVIGIGLSYLVSSLLLEKKPHRILCLELSQSILSNPHVKMNLENQPDTVRVAVVHDDADVSGVVGSYYFPQFFGSVAIVTTPGYNAVLKHLGFDVAGSVTGLIAAKQSDFITQAHLGRVWSSNIAKNLSNLAGKKQAILPRSDSIHVFGAGPGLERLNIQLPLSSGALMLCSDASLNWFSYNKLHADALMSFDAQNISYIHLIGEQNRLDAVHMIDLCSHPAYARAGNHIFAMRSAHPLLSYFYDRGLRLPMTDTRGGNVGHALVSAAFNQFGAERVFCFGLDYAYIDTLPYARPGFMHKKALTESSRIKSCEHILSDLYIGQPHTVTVENGNTIVRTQRLTHYREAFLSAAVESDQRNVVVEGPSWQGGRFSFGWGNDGDPATELAGNDGKNFDPGFLRKLSKDYLSELEMLRAAFDDPLDCWDSGSQTQKTILLTLLPIMAWSMSFLLKQYPGITDIRCRAFDLACTITTEIFDFQYGSVA